MTLADDLRRHNSGVLRARAANHQDALVDQGLCAVCETRQRAIGKRKCNACSYDRREVKR